MRRTDVKASKLWKGGSGGIEELHCVEEKKITIRTYRI